MGSSTSVQMSNIYVEFKTINNKIVSLWYHDLVDHILLLRQVIHHPELTQEGEILNMYINDYCKRMGQQKMEHSHKKTLPWQIDWIWHVHRLHPHAYYNDCIKHLSYVVDKTIRNLRIKEGKSCVSTRSKSSCSLLFVPSINLAEAAIRQREFLEKFQNHPLYSANLEKFYSFSFQKMLHSYALFMSLARKNQILVPTFDIDLIWHTHMRFPIQYRHSSETLCGFVLNHDDSNETDILNQDYQETANRWKTTFKTDYNQNLDEIYSTSSISLSSCGTIFSTYFPLTKDTYITKKKSFSYNTIRNKYRWTTNISKNVKGIKRVHAKTRKNRNTAFNFHIGDIFNISSCSNAGDSWGTGGDYDTSESYDAGDGCGGGCSED